MNVVAPEEALPGRAEQPFRLAERHLVLDAPLVTDEVPDGFEVAVFGLGCFWGAEEIFWQVPGVWSTSVGYAGGSTPHPSYEEVCSGRTGHTEAVRVVYDPAKVDYADLVAHLLRGARPDAGHASGQRRRHAVPLGHLLHLTRAGADRARDHRRCTSEELAARGFDEITTEIAPLSSTTYYYAEDYHQQYLHKNPHGYRCHAKTGVPVPR